MNARRLIDIALATAGAIFIIAAVLIMIMALTGPAPTATLDAPAQGSVEPEYGPPLLAIPRGGARTLRVTSRDPGVPLALKLRSANSATITLSAGVRGAVRAAQPEAVLEGRETMLPLGRLPLGTTLVRIYANTVPAKAGPPITVEEVRVAWQSSASTTSTIAVWVVIVSLPLFLMLLITRLAIAPKPDQ